MVHLWEVTPEQAEEMPAPQAKKLLEMDEEIGSSPLSFRELSHSVLNNEWNPVTGFIPAGPPYVLRYDGDLGPEAAEAFNYWQTRLSHEELMKIEIADAMGLNPETKVILLTRFNLPIPWHLRRLGNIKRKIKRSKLGWDDPITAQRFKNGDRVIRLDKRDNMIFLESGLNQWFTTHDVNPLTNVPPTSRESLVLDIDEDNGEPPAEGGRRRRKTRKSKRRAKKTRRHK
jgi:hypothetical protein